MTATIDPIAHLERMARRTTAEDKAKKALAKARVQLVLGRDAKSSFFATLALRLKPEVDWECETAATDGRRLVLNPDWWNRLSDSERLGVMAHEVMHNAMAHHCRREGREPKRWNVACDLAINDLLMDAGFSLPPSVLFAGEGRFSDLPKGLAAESYYERLPQDTGEEDGDDPGGCGGVLDAGDMAACAEAEAEGRVAVALAKQAAKGKGDLPGGLAEMVEGIIDPRVDWRAALREFVSRSLTAKDDYSWAVPNRRYIPQGMYLPSLRSDSLGEIVLHTDTSGSTQPYMERFAAEMNAILDCSPCRVTVVYGDTQVQKVVEWTNDDGPLVLEDVGGGGTRHDHLLDYLARDHDGEPVCVVCLTDGFTSIRKEPPAIPVLWAVTPGGRTELPFGQVIQIEE